MALDKVTTGVIADDAVTGTQIAPNAIEITDVAADVIPVKPHIQPGVLQPAVAGKLLDGTTSHGSNGSTAYGTAQADGRSYYYTDIKGSKPIKDPRIGAHFGSQRHKFKSTQLLEQETATHGTNVYSIDGREWCKIIGPLHYVNNTGHGNNTSIAGTSNYYEITGYFNQANLIFYTNSTSSGRQVNNYINGGSAGTITTQTSVSSPLGSRYVDAGSLQQITFNATITTPGINTLKLVGVGGEIQIYGIELIAQDTTSTATKSQIQIPPQNVVSYGKKFTVSGTPHYDPFNGFTSGSSVTAYVDTATSLGVEGWKNSSTYYRPYNGGRVVKWVDSSGTIKTSVNMMPPNAQNIAGSAISAKANASVANNTYLPTFSGAIDHSQAEVAKTFHWREFGNGAANGGTGATYADASMMNGTDDIAYVMDDGLTSNAGDDCSGDNAASKDLLANGDGDFIYYTFIGTGVSFDTRATNSGNQNIIDVAQNLPYGTHILKFLRGGTHKLYIDGVEVKSGTLYGFWEITFHQPKMPPIPEDAVVLADYMLMADYVKSTAGAGEKVSKGVRLVSSSRDCFFDSTAGYTFSGEPNVWHPFGISIYNSSNPSAGVSKVKLPAFGTQMEWGGYADSGTARGDIFVDGVDTDNTATVGTHDVDVGYTGLLTQDTASTLGVHIFESRNSGTNNHNTTRLGIATPIHTSSHYQTFETPFLHELVGGDRNMEQTNLIVTPDGKSWDEVTRDVSYIGPECVFSTTDTVTTWSSDVVFDEWRGTFTYATAGNSRLNGMNKDFAIAYDRLICLRDGTYKWSVLSRVTGGADMMFYINGTERQVAMESTGATIQTFFPSIDVNLKRGDFLQVKGEFGLSGNFYYNNIQITKLD